MNEVPAARLRSVGALLAGFFAVVLSHLGTDVLLHATGIFPPWGQPMSDALFVLALAYRTVFSVAGCYLTARLAPHHPLRHALIGGAIGFVLSVVGAAAAWNTTPPLGPRWYLVALIVSALPCAWAGGKLRELQLRAASAR